MGAEEVFWGSKVCMVACDASGPDDPISHHRLVVTEVVELWACCQGEKDCWSSTMSKKGPGWCRHTWSSSTFLVHPSLLLQLATTTWQQ